MIRNYALILGALALAIAWGALLTYACSYVILRLEGRAVIREAEHITYHPED